MSCACKSRTSTFLWAMALIALTSSLTTIRTSTQRIRSKSLCMSSFNTVTPHQQILSVAPMMAHTNRHFRTFWRYISKKSVLYTEMVVADMIVTAASRGNSFQIDKHFGHNGNIEDPLVLQLGGNDPEKLRQAAEIAYRSGFRSINLNCGCPSNTVASSNSMGAAMMYTPERTAQCCAAIISALTSLQTSEASKISNEPLSANLETTSRIMKSSEISFSVKCRTGVDDLDSYEDLYNFVKVVSSQGGVNRFQIHARKAILGVSTMANRDIPPLQYARVYRLISDFPHIEFEINGAISSPEAVHLQLSGNKGLKGVMVGRACINHPYMWINTDRDIYNDTHQVTLSRGDIIEKYISYLESVELIEKDWGKGKGQGVEGLEKSPVRALLAPVYNLFNGEEYCERFRRDLQKMSTRCVTSSLILKAAVHNIPHEALHGRRGEYRDQEDIVTYDKMKKSTGRMKITIS